MADDAITRRGIGVPGSPFFICANNLQHIPFHIATRDLEKKKHTHTQFESHIYFVFAEDNQPRLQSRPETGSCRPDRIWLDMCCYHSEDSRAITQSSL